jgi:hypothetical protein
MVMLTNPGHVYGLSYRLSNKRKGELGTLVVRFSLEAWKRLETFLSDHPIITERVDAGGYLRTAFKTSWEDPRLGLETEPWRFGFDECAYVLDLGEEVEVCFPLTEKEQWAIALSLKVLFLAADVALLGEENEFLNSNRFQFLTISTRCTHEQFCGHGAGGHVYPGFRNWLLKKAGQPLDEVEESLRDAYYALWEFENKKEEREFKRFFNSDFRARISEDGRFQLDCFGNACDLSMYPDGDLGPDHWAQFDCHNLDTVTQQLTLLAGLAALCDLAAREMELK